MLKLDSNMCGSPANKLMCQKTCGETKGADLTCDVTKVAEKALKKADKLVAKANRRRPLNAISVPRYGYQKCNKFVADKPLAKDVDEEEDDEEEEEGTELGEDNSSRRRKTTAEATAAPTAAPTAAVAAAAAVAVEATASSVGNGNGNGKDDPGYLHVCRWIKSTATQGGSKAIRTSTEEEWDKSVRLGEGASVGRRGKASTIRRGGAASFDYSITTTNTYQGNWEEDLGEGLTEAADQAPLKLSSTSGKAESELIGRCKRSEKMNKAGATCATAYIHNLSIDAKAYTEAGDNDASKKVTLDQKCEKAAKAAECTYPANTTQQKSWDKFCEKLVGRGK